MEFDFKLGNLTPADIWREKDDIIEREFLSKREWDTMDENERQAVLRIVDRALDALRDRLEVWVPHSLNLETGNYVEVSFRILFSDFEREQEAVQEVTDRMIQSAAERTARIVQELSDD